MSQDENVTAEEELDPTTNEETAEEAAEENESVEVVVSDGPVAQYEPIDIPIGNIEVNVMGFHNPRRVGMGDVNQIKNDIKENGLLYPLLVHEEQGEDGFRYLLIDGHRRLEAIKEIRREQATINNGDTAGWYDNIRCIVHQGPLADAASIAMSVSLHHSALCFADRSQGVAYLFEQLRDQGTVARKLNVSQPTISNLLSVYRNCIPEAFAALRLGSQGAEGGISQAFAVELSRMRTSRGDGHPDVAAQQEALAAKLAHTPSTRGTRPRTYQSRASVEAMQTSITAEEEIDPVRKQAILDTCGWFFMRIDADQLVAGTDELGEDPDALAALDDDAQPEDVVDDGEEAVDEDPGETQTIEVVADTE